MLKQIAVILVLAGSLAACGQVIRQSTRPVPADAAVAAQQLPAQADGKAVFDAVCTSCHTIDPPAGTAPPMSHVARHYRAELDGEEAVVARIAEWITEPDRERSLLPAHAVERWGVMPQLGLDRNHVEAVARYVGSLGETGGMGQRQGMMMQHGQAAAGQQGQGMMMHHGHAAAGQEGMGQGMMMMRRGAMADSSGGDMDAMGEMCPMMQADSAGRPMMQHRHGGSTPPDTGTVSIR